jgi:hypothetical protein
VQVNTPNGVGEYLGFSGDKALVRVPGQEQVQQLPVDQVTAVGPQEAKAPISPTKEPPAAPPPVKAQEPRVSRETTEPSVQKTGPAPATVEVAKQEEKANPTAEPPKPAAALAVEPPKSSSIREPLKPEISGKGKYAVIEKETGEVVGRHDNLADAQKQMADTESENRKQGTYRPNRYTAEKVSRKKGAFNPTADEDMQERQVYDQIENMAKPGKPVKAAEVAAALGVEKDGRGAFSRTLNRLRQQRMIDQGENGLSLRDEDTTPEPPQQLGLETGAPRKTFSERLQDVADAATERMRKRGSFSGSKLNSMPDPADLADLAFWGAAKLAKGTVNFAGWSKEMVDEFGDLIKPHLKDLYAKAQKTYARHIDKTGDRLPTTKRLLQMIEDGKAGAEWYDNTHRELVDMFGPDAELIEKFLAATSPNNTVAGNVTQALKAYRQYRLGQYFEGFLPLHEKFLNAIDRGEDFGGIKVESFLKNLKGDPMAVTVDRWIARAFNFGKTVTDKQYKFVDYWITQLAKRVGMEPRQVQAAIWKAIKEEQEGRAAVGAFETLLPKKIAKDPKMQELIQRAKAGESAPDRPPSAPGLVNRSEISTPSPP